MLNKQNSWKWGQILQCHALVVCGYASSPICEPGLMTSLYAIAILSNESFDQKLQAYFYVVFFSNLQKKYNLHIKNKASVNYTSTGITSSNSIEYE